MKKAIFIALAILAVLTPVWAQTKPAEIRIVSKDFGPGDKDNLVHVDNIAKAFKAKTGIDIKITLVAVSEGNYQDRLTLMLMTGDIPDIIYFQGGDEFVSNKGMLADLRPYINKSDVMKKAMLPFNVKRINNYPYLLWLAPPILNVPAIRADWLTKAGGKFPVTPDDYYNLFKKMAAGDYDGNGKADTIPVTETGNTARLDFLFNHAFGEFTTWVKDSSGKYVYSKVTAAEKNKLAFYQKLFKEGLLDKDYITTKFDGMEDKLYTSRLGMVVGRVGQVIDIYETKLAKAGKGSESLVVGPPAKGVGQGFTLDVSKESRGWAISAGSKNKDIAWKLLEFMASDEGQTLDRLGPEGIYHTKTGGKITLTDKFSTWFPRFHEVVGWKPPLQLIGETAQESLAIAIKYATVEDINFVLPKELGPAFDASNNKYKEWSFGFVSGAYSMDKFDEFVKEWYAAGGDKITEYANKTLK